jgi:hypothetical protein
MSASNEKPEGRNTEAKGPQHEGALDADAGEALDMNALEEVSGGQSGQIAVPRESVVDYFDALTPPKAIGGREGKSGA